MDTVIWRLAAELRHVYKDWDDLFTSDSVPLDTAFLSPVLHNVRVLVRWISYALQHDSDRKRYSILETLFETTNSETDFKKEDRARLYETFNKWYSILTADYSGCCTIWTSELPYAIALLNAGVS